MQPTLAQRSGKPDKRVPGITHNDLQFPWRDQSRKKIKVGPRTANKMTGRWTELVPFSSSVVSAQKQKIPLSAAHQKPRAQDRACKEMAALIDAGGDNAD